MTALARSRRPRRADQATQPALPMSIPAGAQVTRPRFELSTLCSSAFDSDDWVFGVAWEGSRCMLDAAADGSVRLHGATAELTARFPEIAATGPLRPGRAAVLDVTVCVLGADGRADLPALSRRVTTRGRRPLAVALATDVLRCDGLAVDAHPLEARLDLLRELVLPDCRVQVPDQVRSHGRALAVAAAGRGLSGLVARRRDARYLAGVASPDRLAIPLVSRRDLVVMGWFSTPSGVGVVLGEWSDGRLEAAGTAAVEDAAVVRWLSEVVGPARRARQGEAAGAPAGLTWVRPHLVATVDPSPSRPPGGLPGFDLVALRDDVDASWCVRRPAVDPPQSAMDTPPRPFSPTVLSALPLGA